MKFSTIKKGVDNMANKYANMFVAGGLKVPEKILKKETFAAAMNFSAPTELDLRWYCTPVENQGNLPYCAAYSASSFAENILWRKRNYYTDIDPVPLYKYAKTIDGDPTGAGTLLECTMEALLAKGYFDKDICRIRQIGGSYFDNGNVIRDVKFAIHKYGVCMAGFNITSEWYAPKNNIIKGGKFMSEGGHAVIICGYSDLKKAFLIMNSWGNDYAEGGFVWISYDEFVKESMYFTVMTHVLDE